MAYTLWSQDIFSKGELSPFMYARATVNEYGNGLKTAQNVLTYPTGAVGKRFGTLYQATLSNITAFNQIYFETWQYLNEAVYQVVMTPLNIAIYLEGILVANVTTTLTAYQVYNASTTVLGAAFRIAFPGLTNHPMDLKRSANSPVAITSFTSTTISASSAPFPGSGFIYPVQFTVTGGMIMVTNPQVATGITYFLATTSTTTAAIFATSQQAKQFIINNANTEDAITITNLGTGTTSINILNTWTIAPAVFKNLPVYDFNGITTSYDGLTFTPSATTGTGVTITITGGSYAPLNSSYVGGAFIGAGGTSRITAVATTTSFTVSVQTPFDSVNGIQGSLAFLAEPAWSDTRGWPTVCSSYQNRALFANTVSLPNGFYASVINDYTDFGDLTGDDDDAISWYPTSNNMNFIRFIVPYRSITVHTNTGIYSSPLSDVAAITPSNFTLQLQDSTPADTLLPQAIDNQVLVLSGNDAHQMLWDGINNAYTSNVVSIINEQVIRNPVDETSFQDLQRAGSRFVFIVNANGSLATYQTLLSQNVSGFTPQFLEQSYGSAQFLQVASSSDSRCWFIMQRQIAEAASPVAIIGFIPESPTVISTLEATGTNFSLTEPTAIMFTTSGTLPASSPQIITGQYYWAIGTDANDFEVYLTQEDALAATNAIAFTSAGTSSNVVPWLLNTIFTLEEYTQDVFLDCAIQYSGSPTDTVSTGVLFNAQSVKMVGDGFGFVSPAEGNTNDQIIFTAHGSTVPVSNAYIGFPIVTIMEPMPLTISSGPSAKETTLTKPKRIMFVRFMFKDTIGGFINDVPIALAPFDEANIGEPPFPETGFVELAVFKAWDDFTNPTYTIYHDDPFDIQLLGVFYSVDI